MTKSKYSNYNDYNEKLKHEGWSDLREKKRGCTDVCFMLFLIAAWAFMTFVGLCATGLIQIERIPAGNPDRLIYPLDYQGKLCGKDIPDKKYGYYLPDRSVVCVKSCPAETNYYKFVCQYNLQSAVNNNTALGYQYLAMFSCMYEIPTKGLVHRCIPVIKDLVGISDAALSVAEGYGVNATAIYTTATNQNTSWFTTFVGDMWSLLGYVFGFGIGVTVLIGFVYLFLLQIPGLLHLIIWLVILAVLAIFALGSYLLLRLSYTWEEDDIHSMTEVKTMRGVSYTGFVITFLYICLVLVMRKRIMLAIGIVKRTARALLTMPTLLFVPVIQSMGNALFLIPWAIYVFCLASSGTMQNKTNSYTLNGQTIAYEYRTFEYTNNTKYAFLYLLFCWFWTSEFIVALGQIIISLAFSLWYFTRDKSQRGLVSVSWAFKAGIFYHSGTAAFGALLIAIVKTIRAVLTYIQRNAKKYKSSRILQFIMCILQCFMCCLEHILKFMNKNAYIITAIYGTSFCTSTRKAFFLLLRNILRVAAVNLVSTFVLYIGRLFIPLATTFALYLVLAYWINSTEMSGIIGPLVFTFVLSYFVSSVFIEIYGMGIETILMCFIADEEMFPPGDRFAEGFLVSTIDKTREKYNKLYGAVPLDDLDDIEDDTKPSAPPAGGEIALTQIVVSEPKGKNISL